MKVSLIDFMGSDLTVVNAARVSFNKQSEMLQERDEELIIYLASHGHWTPFAHPQLQFRISAPIFVARQLGKHQVGLAWNEVSRRYVNYEPELYTPIEWREKPEMRKQGSSKNTVFLPLTDRDDIEKLLRSSVELYERLIKKGIAPEQARMILPQSMYTEWIWSGSLYAFSRVYNLRASAEAQAETKTIVDEIGMNAVKHFPVSWRCLTENPEKEIENEKQGDLEEPNAEKFN